MLPSPFFIICVHLRHLRSHGGFHYRFLDLFAWVGGMSSAVRDPEQSIGQVWSDPNSTNEKLKLLWIGCGKDDFLLKINQQFDQLLTTHGIRHEFKLSEGGHSWPVWRRYLAEFLPQIFTQ
jgi:enterochelin esterase-like enzyme